MEVKEENYKEEEVKNETLTCRHPKDKSKRIIKWKIVKVGETYNVKGASIKIGSKNLNN